jgi:uncharacterized protein (TIGR02246 family)
MRRVAMLFLFLSILAPGAFSAGPDDEAAIRKIIDDEVAAWNAGDAKAYAGHFAEGGTFTNIYGMFFEGHQAFEERHAEIFATFFKGTARKQTIRKLRFVTPEVAVVDVDTEVRNIRSMPGVTLPADGILRTRLQEVFVKRNGAWWIEAFHNVEAKGPPGRAPSRPPAAGSGK